MTDARVREAFNWAIDGKHLRVYPQPIDGDIYTAKRLRNGKYRTVSINKVRLVIEIEGSKHLGKFIYKQDAEMSIAVGNIYLHYYNQRTITNK